jgi:BNR/Asp-box repeat
LARFGFLAAGAAALSFLFGVAFAGATGTTKVVLVSRCGGVNAEVEQAVAGRFVYEAWIGCHGIGFARSVNGGRTFGATRHVPSQGHLWDPALAVAPDGTVYVSYMITTRTAGGTLELTPAVAVSVDHGHSFARVSVLPVPTPASPTGNWGDRDFIAVGFDGTVYVTWDYGPSAAEVSTHCNPGGSCTFSSGDFNAVIQKSTDGGKTWTMPSSVSPGFPLGGVYSAPIVVEPNGTLGVLYWGHPTDPSTLAVSPGSEYFTRSSDGGVTWSSPVAVDPGAGSIALPTWWIDGSLAVDSSGSLYATWDTQSGTRDTGWLATSTDGGQTWSSPLRVTSGSTGRLIEVAATGAGSVYVGWQTRVRRKGYATYLRRLAAPASWTGRTKRISHKYGGKALWPGDTFGLSTRGGTAIVSWGSNDEIYATRATLPAHHH